MSSQVDLLRVCEETLVNQSAPLLLGASVARPSREDLSTLMWQSLGSESRASCDTDEAVACMGEGARRRSRAQLVRLGHGPCAG